MRNIASRAPLIGGAMLIAAAGLFAPAHAHFILVTPDSWMSQDALGSPQKLGPCGNEGGGTPSGKVTAFRPGETITVTINEVIPHPGHYRVALAIDDRSELPPDPLVTPSERDPCASAAIQDPPVFPVLADNLLPHTQPFRGPQTFTVTLPSDVTCTKCTLQVLEYMSNHSVPCFYYHCADISIQGAVVTPAAIPTATVTQPATATATPTPTPTPPAVTTCVGDCGGTGTVTVAQLILMVNIALGAAPLDACRAGDADGDHQIIVTEVLMAVSHAMRGCPTPSPFTHKAISEGPRGSPSPVRRSVWAIAPFSARQSTDNYAAPQDVQCRHIRRRVANEVAQQNHSARRGGENHPLFRRQHTFTQDNVMLHHAEGISVPRMR